MVTPQKTMGILGGMGPAASADFYRRLVDIAQHTYGADQDTDFPTMHLYNLPLAGFDETGFRDPEHVQAQLVAAVQKLESAGSDFIVIPCNTVHAFFNEMQTAVRIPIVSIIEAVATEASRQRVKKVGILCSQSTREYMLYENIFTPKGIAVLSTTEEEQKTINVVVHHVMAGTQGTSDTETLEGIIARFKKEGAEGVVVGCTELPLAIDTGTSPLPLFNSTEILAHAALREAYGAES